MASGAHSKKSGRAPVRGVAAIAIVVGVVGLVVAVAGATNAVNHGKHAPSQAKAAPTTIPPTPISLLSFSPTANATNVAAATPVTLHFSAPLAADTAQPTISPSVAGSWTTAGSTMTFTPAGGWIPFTTVKVTVPSGLAGAAGSDTTPLASAASVSFTVAPGSTLRLQELLAELGYLPLKFTPTSPAPTTTTPTTTVPDTATSGPSTAGTSPSSSGTLPVPSTSPSTSTPTTSTASSSAATNAVTTSPVPGTFSWRFPNTPSSLKDQWAQGLPNTIDRGAIMAFQSAHGLATDGVAGPDVWSTLLVAAAKDQANTRPYNYLMVSESSPETLQVWSDGRIIASSLAKTGISAAPTALGTYPVYARYASTTMTGLNPDGTKYRDPGVRWVAYFNGGDAVHQFPRPGYGWPQSLGCVELPSSTAENIWGTDPIGTLVSVL
jgi:peptidoglycan hydrolase-like protein with peptidoglycan-binding domain